MTEISRSKCFLVKTLFSLVVCIMCTVSASAQQKQFSLDELLGGGESFWRLRPENMYTTWWGNMALRSTPEGVYDVHTGKEILTVEHINKCFTEKVVFSGHNFSFPMGEEPVVMFTKGLRRVMFDFHADSVILDVTLPQNAVMRDFNVKTKQTAYTVGGNLYVCTPNGEAIAVSQDGSVDGSDNIVYGQSVHRDEFGIHGGTFWSPNGKLLAYYRMDQSMVPSYPQVNIKSQGAVAGESRIASTYSCHYPMAGEKSHHVTVGVFNTETKQNVWLNLEGEKDDYHTNISWTPDGQSIYVFELNRDQNHMRLVQYNVASGEKIRTVLEEKHEKYVEPMHGLTFLPWDNSKAVMQSQRDGYNHLYILDLKTCEIKQLTKGKWVVQQFVGFNTVARRLVFRSNESDPRQSCLYSVGVKGGKRIAIGKEEGVCNGAQLSANGVMVIQSYTAPEVPRSVNLLYTATGKGKNLLTAADPWKEQGYSIPTFKSGSIKAADGVTDLYYRMVLPADFDEAKQYPTVVYVYGGPHAHLVEASWHWSSRGWETYMAQKGYITFILDSRGSEWRGLEFEQATFRQLGTVECQDQRKGVDYLMSLPYVDKDRIGVHGWSFGGFMTTNLMLTYPEVFKVGVAGGPVIDWNYYEVMYGERYMDTPEQNPDGYKNSNLRLRAGNLKGRLQLIIGYNDPVCVPQHTLSFIRACIDAGTQCDYFLYPGGEHNMYGKDAVHLHERITRYFEDYLK
ncbi:MAG: DPP IV N-terminal domain-containing protein [Bacteroidaceae bacterium]|nr:DPP IV N-terminal domain-containing protein [Bacteroidaceae bacterium]